jgi:hypothetical protein
MSSVVGVVVVSLATVLFVINAVFRLVGRNWLRLQNDETTGRPCRDDLRAEQAAAKRDEIAPIRA